MLSLSIFHDSGIGQANLGYMPLLPHSLPSSFSESLVATLGVIPMPPAISPLTSEFCEGVVSTS